MIHYVYMLRLQNGQIYVGSSHDPEQRFKTHLAGRGSLATLKSKPVEVIYTEPFPDRASAVRRERQLKGWSQAKNVDGLAHHSGPTISSTTGRPRRKIATEIENHEDTCPQL